MNDLLRMAVGIRDDLRPVEELADVSLGKLGKLLHTACQARVASGIRPDQAHAALSQLSKAIELQVSARSAVLAAHVAFGELKMQHVPEVGLGDWGCPGQPKAEAEAVLRIVA